MSRTKRSATSHYVVPVDRCEICGCTDSQACPGGCWWVHPGMCSACEFKPSAELLARLTPASDDPAAVEFLQWTDPANGSRYHLLDRDSDIVVAALGGKLSEIVEYAQRVKQ